MSKDMDEWRLIEESESPWSSHVVLGSEKNRDHLVFVDYR
jgi:hypothetical protein